MMLVVAVSTWEVVRIYHVLVTAADAAATLVVTPLGISVVDVEILWGVRVNFFFNVSAAFLADGTIMPKLCGYIAIEGATSDLVFHKLTVEECLNISICDCWF